MLEELGVDYVIELDFDKIKNLHAEEYLRDILVKYFSPVAITTGSSHYFGKNKSGDTKLLAQLQSKYNYTYFVAPSITLNGVKVSSTEIRKSIAQGDVELAKSLLGRPFAISGTVQKGKQMGHKFGFPTANIFYPVGIIQPPRGVYDVDVKLQNGAKLRGLANYGVCPTVTNSGVTTFETHILDFNGDIYGQDIIFEFNRKIRDEMKFENIERLKAQIAIDISSIKE